ncbi:hypothetical protein RST01_14670 [Rummeliibacillus stabekisii]|nr:hypothetical protein RST01_14670 [Rummeliibacillus stabekisii]
MIKAREAISLAFLLIVKTCLFGYKRISILSVNIIYPQTLSTFLSRYFYLENKTLHFGKCSL